MISRRQMRKRVRDSVDTSFAAQSSTLPERLSDLARAGSMAEPRSARSRAARWILAVAESVGLIGWVTMGTAGAMAVAAATGVLPDPVQQVVADVVHVVGIDLRDPAHERSIRVRNLAPDLEVDRFSPGPDGCPEPADETSGAVSTRMSPDDTSCVGSSLQRGN